MKSAAAVCLLLAAGAAGDFAQQVQRDWLIQREVAQKGMRPSTTVTAAADAAGAVDGVRNGRWGFHTGAGRPSWWQVDLGRSEPLDRAAIWNRCDIPSRAASLVVLLSDDGRGWTRVYQHDGTVFLGHTDGKPLRVDLKGAAARFLRIQIPGSPLHLDEVEVFARARPGKNIALGRPANQSSASRWSTGKIDPNPDKGLTYPIGEVVARGRRLAEDLARKGVDVRAALAELQAAAEAGAALGPNGPREARRAVYFRARWAVRRLAFRNPLLDFQTLLFAKRVPGRYSHMSDQYYGWWSRPGGGIFVLEGWKDGRPRERCLTGGMAEGSFLRPDLSFDARKALFAYCRHYPRVAGAGNKADKDQLPEDAFYHVHEMDLARGAPGASPPRRLTRGRYDDFDARYLPGGRIVFLSTRKGRFVQCGRGAAATCEWTLPDSYVRCGGGSGRPVAVYTLHTMDGDGGDLRAISAFESFEWTPAVAADGRVLYARWDYFDRPNGPYMSLWSANPDGTNPQLVYGNYTVRPHCIFEARCVPGSRRLVFTASGHHYVTGGPLVLLDPDVGTEGAACLRRITPEVPFPEAEGRPMTYYANPWPLSEDYYLVAWSSLPLRSEGSQNAPNALGLYLLDRFGNLELIWRDEKISCMYPIPLRPRTPPPVHAGSSGDDGDDAARLLVADVYRGLEGVERGSIRRLRLVAAVPKIQPQMNRPNLGVTREDPGKFVLGTVPVEADGSAHFRVPAGVGVFFQALDGDGLAVQTMRGLTYAQPGQRLSCAGCHEPRNTAPPSGPVPQAARRAASRITPGPDGSWPLRFDALVGPVLERRCVRCHRPGGPEAAAGLDLTAGKAYESLVGSRRAGLGRLAGERSVSVPGDCVARRSGLLKLLSADHHRSVRLDADDRRRLVTWMDVYCHRQGCFGPQQEDRVRRLRKKWADILERP